jgi:Cdc6-like AAA superfamily ATPase
VEVTENRIESREHQSQLRNKIYKIFKPGTPIRSIDLFAGRERQRNALLSAVMQPGRHALLFGERGVGKTSLAQVLVDLERGNGFRTLKNYTVNCDESDDFTSLWHKVFCALPYTEKNGRTVYTDSMHFETLDTLISPDSVRDVLSLFEEPCLIVIDEIDQLKDENAKRLLAATIKNLSDHEVNTTLVLVGVADTVNELIVEQKSAERALIQVRMPRMSDEELIQIIDQGLEYLGMEIEDFPKALIVGLSGQFPFYTHSFCLNAGLKAIDAGRTLITRSDVTSAVLDVVADAEHVNSAYHTATHSTQSKNRYKVALLACAVAEPNENGYFTAGEMCSWMSALQGRERDIPRDMHYLTEFCDPKRGGVLQQMGGKWSKLYRFKDPLMKPFLIIKSFGDRELGPEVLSIFVKVPPKTIQEELPLF